MIKNFLLRICDWCLNKAKRDPDISFDEYKEVEIQYNKTVKEINK